jgi:hypothetical protein
MNRSTVVLAAGTLFVSAACASAAPAANSADWLPVDQNVWTILMDEPQAHLLRAQEDLSNKDVKAAAAEIRLADTFLKLQEKRLEASSERLNELAKGVESNKIASPKEVEDAFSKAIAVLDYRQNMIPVMEGADDLYLNEADYHLAQAEQRLKKEDGKGAAADMRKASAYLRLKAVRAGEDAKRALESSAVELEALAEKAERGGASAARDMDSAFARARKAVRGVL